MADVGLAQQRDHEHHLDHAGRVVDAVGVRRRAAVPTRRRPRTRSGPARPSANRSAAATRFAQRVVRARRLGRAPRRRSATTDRRDAIASGSGLDPASSVGTRASGRAARRTGARHGPPGLWCEAMAEDERRRTTRDRAIDIATRTAPSIGPNTVIEKDDSGGAPRPPRAVRHRRDGPRQAPRGRRRPATAPASPARSSPTAIVVAVVAGVAIGLHAPRRRARQAAGEGRGRGALDRQRPEARQTLR